MRFVIQETMARHLFDETHAMNKSIWLLHEAGVEGHLLEFFANESYSSIVTSLAASGERVGSSVFAVVSEQIASRPIYP